MDKYTECIFYCICEEFVLMWGHSPIYQILYLSIIHWSEITDSLELIWEKNILHQTCAEYIVVKGHSRGVFWNDAALVAGVSSLCMQNSQFNYNN